MPIYEYRCNACKALSSFFTRSISQPPDPVCGSCASRDMARAISSFAYHKTIQQVHEESGPPPGHPSFDYYKDPRNIGRYVEDTFRKSNMEIPKSVQETIDAAREGTMPKELDL